MSEQKEFEFNYEPIRGYPELRWTGKRPFTGTPYYPAQLKESYGDDIDGWRNKIYWGDNLQVMSHLLKDYRGKVNLIYIDPPFDSKAEYKKKIELKGKTTEIKNYTNFEEKQYGDIWTNDEYLQFMYERLILCRELLADDGSIYLHCDWHKNHYLRSMMDEIFGYGNFINEIAWHYGTYVGQTKNNYPRKHDTILIYGKTSQHYFCMQRDGNLESDANYKRWKKFFTADNKIVGSNYPKDDSKFDGYVKRFIKEHGYEPKDSKDILLDIDGKLVDSVWEIQSINPMSKERTDYPTQKPEELLERIVLTSSKPDDLVFDCFMGSGTTQAVAMKLGRRFIGADINLGAVQTSTKRLIKVAKDLSGRLQTENQFYTGFEVYNVNDYEFFRNELEAKRLICEAMGMEQLTDSNVYDALYEGRKVCILGINRIATASEFAKLLSNVNISEWQERQKENPTKPVEQITFVCMGHDPNLKAQFEEEVSKMGFKVDVEIIDLLRDKKDLRFKRDSDAKVIIKNGKLIIENFYPMNLLQKLSIEKTDVSDWKELAESIFIDWNYDGVTFSPETTDIPEKNGLVKGEYEIPKSAGTIHIKITDLISESWEGNVEAE